MSLQDLLHYPDWTDETQWIQSAEAARKQLSISRDKLADALLDLHKAWNPSKKTESNIEALRHPKTVVMVTGQQCNLFGGPSMIAHKAMSIIIQSNKLRNILGVEVVPVFWLADEDHDLAEVLEGFAWKDSLDDAVTLDLTWPNLTPDQVIASSAMAGSLTLPSSLANAPSEWTLSSSVRQTLSTAYQEGDSLRDGMAKWLSSLFGKHGLVMFSRQHNVFAEASAPFFSKAVLDAESIQKALRKSTEDVLAVGGHQQASVDGSVLFHVTEKGMRYKWASNNDTWTHAGMKKGEGIHSKALSEHIKKHPHEMSPNVFMRLILQSALLPVVGAALGPAELAYAGQSTALFEWAGLRQPVWMPRYSLTLLDGGKQKWLDELGLEWTSFQQPVHELQKEWVVTSQPKEIEESLSKWESSVEDQAGKVSTHVQLIDATLKASVEASKTRMNKEIERVKAKIRRSIRRRETHQMTRIERLAARIMPAGVLQERGIATWSALTHFGDHLYDNLIDALSDHHPDGHFLIQFDGVLQDGVLHDGVLENETSVTKKAIRAKALKERRMQPSKTFKSRSKRLNEHLIQLIQEEKPSSIATFIPRVEAHEPDIRPAIETAWGMGIDVYAPSWSLNDPDMKFLRISSWEDLTLDSNGYLQPNRDKMASKSTIDVLWVPALALDKKGGRIGYGKGYFDRAIKQLSSKTQRWALCFSEWVYDEALPQEPHDEKMHRIITESQIFQS